MLYRLLLALPLCLLASLAQASSEATPYSYHDVFVPIIYKTGNDQIKTSACLKVAERVYGSNDTFEMAARINGSPEGALLRLFEALKSKNRDGLKAATHARLGQDPAEFETQMQAYFLQFMHMNERRPLRAWRFDDMVLFLLSFRDEKGALNYADFTFALRDDGSGYGFLPYRFDRQARDGLRDWLLSPWGPISSPTPSYCSEAELEHNNLHITLHPDVKPSTSEVYIAGSKLPAADPRSQFALNGQRFKQLQDVMVNMTLADFGTIMTPAYAGRMRSWHQLSTVDERTAMREEYTKLSAAYTLDAGNLQVVYTRRAGDVGLHPLFLIRVGNDATFRLDGTNRPVNGLFNTGSVKTTVETNAN